MVVGEVRWEGTHVSAGLWLFSQRIRFLSPSLDWTYRSLNGSVVTVGPECIPQLCGLRNVLLLVQQGADYALGEPITLTDLRRECDINLNASLLHFSWDIHLKIIYSGHCPCHTILVGIIISAPWRALCQGIERNQTLWDMLLLQMANYFHFVFILLVIISEGDISDFDLLKLLMHDNCIDCYCKFCDV